MTSGKSIMSVGCGILVLALASAAQAVVTNPDGFEGYATTTGGWTPTQLDQAWETSHGTAGANIANIVDSTDSNGDPTQVLDMFDASGPNVGAKWFPNIDGVTNPVQTLSIDFQLLSFTPGDGESSFKRFVLTDFGSHMEFVAGSSGVIFGSTTSPNDFTQNALDGGAVAADTWYTVELEIDLTAGTGRARFGETGDTFGDWSDSYLFNKGTDSPLLFTNGHNQFDNVGIVAVPEPASMALLGLGGLVMLGRRRG